ncbi:hypothetical protein E3P99_03463 [Wallemia hederae]|uniref:Actin-like ATPase domain-containing protein n=1 Tax=Wallemia hederae TaxID=1540922 RepID=A0A4T0FF84_9BASI|nr:hypothetical protein E3P99_03463 [Wallemia hederae]
MPDWAKLAEKGKEYGNKGIDRGKKAYSNTRSAPTNKADPFKPPKEAPPAPSPSMNRPLRTDIPPPPLRPDSSRSSSNHSQQSPSAGYRAPPRAAPRGNTYATPASSGPSFPGRSVAQTNPRLPVREDLPQYPGQPSNMFRENKDQFFGFLDEFFARNPPRNAQQNEPKGYADCIANEDGQRQIASALAYNGEEEYVGNQAKPQLVRNYKNTLTGFRNLLGESFSDSIQQPLLSAPVINNNGVPSYKVAINGKDEILSVKDVTVKVLQSLAKSAVEYIGKDIDGAVMSVPHHWSQSKRSVLVDAAKEAKIPVVDLIDDWAAGMSAYNDVLGDSDANVLVVDMGEYSTSVTTVAARQGLFTPLSHLSDDKVGGQQLDHALVAHFAKEFTKQTKINVPTQFSKDLDESDRRALVKLTLACEQTKRSLTASNSAGIAIESLKDGADLSSQVNRLRFGILASKTFNAVGALAEKAVAEAKLEVENIDKIVLIGGSSSLPSLTNVLSGIFYKSEILSSIDPDQAIAKGAAIQAKLLSARDVPDLPSATTELSVNVTAQPIVLAGKDDENAVIVAKDTPLPARRIVSIAAPSSSSAILDLYEAKHDIKIVAPPPREKTEDDSEDEEDDEPERIPVVTRTQKIAGLEVPVKGTEPIVLQVVVLENASVEIKAVQGDAAPVTASVKAP